MADYGTKKPQQGKKWGRIAEVEGKLVEQMGVEPTTYTMRM